MQTYILFVCIPCIKISEREEKGKWEGIKEGEQEEERERICSGESLETEIDR